MSEQLLLADLLEQLVILSVGLRQLVKRQNDRRLSTQTILMEAGNGVGGKRRHSYVAGLGFLPFELCLPVARTRRRSRRKLLRRFRPSKQKRIRVYVWELVWPHSSGKKITGFKHRGILLME